MTVDGIRALVEELESAREDDDEAGWTLHIALEDANTRDGDINWCREKAVEEKDHPLVVRICDGLLSLADDRDRLEALGWPRDYHDDNDWYPQGR